MPHQLTFEDPPENTAYDWASIAEQLRAKPGQWAKVFDKDRASLAVAIRLGGIAALKPEDGFEVKTRNNVREPVRTCTMYLRWNPQKKGRK